MNIQKIVFTVGVWIRGGDEILNIHLCLISLSFREVYLFFHHFGDLRKSILDFKVLYLSIPYFLAVMNKIAPVLVKIKGNTFFWIFPHVFSLCVHRNHSLIILVFSLNLNFIFFLFAVDLIQELGQFVLSLSKEMSFLNR